MARMSTRLLGVRGILRARVGRLITIFREEGGGVGVGGEVVPGR